MYVYSIPATARPAITVELKKLLCLRYDSKCADWIIDNYKFVDNNTKLLMGTIRAPSQYANAQKYILSLAANVDLMPN